MPEPISTLVTVGNSASKVVRNGSTINTFLSDTFRLLVDAGADYTGYTLLAYLQDPTEEVKSKYGSWTDASAGEGYVDITPDELPVAGVYNGEIKILLGTEVHTYLQFTLICNTSLSL